MIIRSEYGRYDLTRNKDIAYITIIEKLDDKLISEAIEFTKKNNKRIILKSNEALKYNKIDSLYRYDFKYEITKSHKEIKLIDVSNSNKDELLKLLNNNLKDYMGYIELSNYDIIDMINSLRCYYIGYKHEIVGCAVVNNDKIEYLVINSSKQKNGIGQLALSKLLFKIGKDSYFYINDSNNAMIKLISKFNILKSDLIFNYYEV